MWHIMVSLDLFVLATCMKRAEGFAKASKTQKLILEYMNCNPTEKKTKKTTTVTGYFYTLDDVSLLQEKT